VTQAATHSLFFRSPPFTLSFSPTSIGVMLSPSPPPSAPRAPLSPMSGWCTYSPLPTLPIQPNPDPTDDSLPGWRHHVQEMPFLDNIRPRALTPSGFRDRIAQQPNPTALFQESAWFKLPPCIRRDILRLAFGDRRVHMGLSYQSRYERDENTEALDVKDNKSWHWFGSVCQRPVLENQPPMPMTCGGNHYGPWSDSCKSGDHRQGFIGMTGWLLSCRQNYAETIDAFYSTNTIAMSGEAMISHIPQLLLPQRLSAITSLEMRWPLQNVPVLNADKKSDQFRLDSHLDIDQFSLVLDILAHKQFPNLQRLYISFEKLNTRRDFSRPSKHTLVAQRLREFVRNRPGLRECAFALPEALFRHITGMDNNRESFSQVWDSLDGSLHMICMPFENSYPGPPFHLEEREQVGFWLLEGSENDYDIPSSPLMYSSPTSYSPQ
ncbi:hypothetical protein KAF25_007688, partial [Fusarium avenaceum]